MLLYVSSGKTGPLVKAPGKSHTRLVMRKPFVCLKHKERERYNKNQYLPHKSRTVALTLVAVKWYSSAKHTKP